MTSSSEHIESVAMTTENVTSAVNTTSPSDPYFPLLKQPLHMVVIFSLAYTVVFVFAFFGNILVIAVVVRHKHMHTVTNYFIANLAISDLLVAIVCVPITLIANLFNGWPLGALLCKAAPYLQGTAISASVYTLAAIAIDRNLAICYMLQFRVTRRICRYTICIIWMSALVGFLPWALYYKHELYPSLVQEIYVCRMIWPHPRDQRYYFLFVFLFFYIIPLIVVSVCYGMIGIRVWFRNVPGISNSSGVIYKSKVRAVKMLLLVFVLFALSWLPLYSLYMWREFTSQGVYSPVAENIILPIAQWLAQANSGINPVIYCFFSIKFREGFLSMVSCCWGQSNDVHTTPNATATKYMSVQYSNGQYQVSLKKLRPHRDDDSNMSERTGCDVVLS